MRYDISREKEPAISTLLDSAEREPVFIERGNQKAVLISSLEYDRLRNTANSEFQQFCDMVSKKAATQTLTEETLQELLKHA